MNIISIPENASLLSREFIDQFCSTLYTGRRSLRTLYGIFLELVRQIYSSQDNLLLGTDTVWDADPKKTKIWIDTEYVWEDQTPEFKPAIYVSLNGLELHSYLHKDGQIGADVREGEKHYARRIEGTVSFTHIGKTKGETTNLVDNTYTFLDSMAPVIASDFCFETFNVTQVTPLQVVKAETDFIGGVVVATFSYQDNWSIKLESPKLKKIVLSTGQAVIDLVK